MANLPPKPESSVKEERRQESRESFPTAHSMLPAAPTPSTPHREYRTDRFSDDRSYVPRSRTDTDTYTPQYARRPPPVRDWERDSRSRDFDRRRDSRRDWREPDRRDIRPHDRWRDDDRFSRRRYDPGIRRSSRSPPRRSRSPRRRSRSPPPRRYSSRSRTRSPRRRGFSPLRIRPRFSSRSRSPPPRSPPPKRLKLGNHSISDSPRTPRARSRSRVRSPSRTRSRSPRRPPDYSAIVNKTSPPPVKEKRLPPASPIITSRLLSPKRTDNALTPQSTVSPASVPRREPLAVAVKVEEKSAMQTETPNSLPPTIPSPTDNVTPIKQEPQEVTIKKEVTKDEHSLLHPKTESAGSHSTAAPKPEVKVELKVEPRGRSHSPPKGPRAQWRRTSKSPPKGPRNHNTAAPSMGPGPVPPQGPRNHGASTPSMPPTAPPPPAGPRSHGPATSSMIATPVTPAAPAPASLQMYPTGPRADRRMPKDDAPITILQSAEFVSIQPPANDRWARRAQGPGPKGRYEITQMELELVRLRSSRINLNKEHEPVSRNTRRALHELDMATIDLRMAETRRKIADAQLEKAKQGLLGIESVSDATSDQVGASGC